MKTWTVDPEQKMTQVVRAARTLFVKKGFHNVSIPQIVKASGVSTGAIYNHFSSKEGLARYIHEQTLTAFQQRFTERLHGQATTFDKLQSFAELVFEITETEPEMMEYMLFMKHGEFLQGISPICATQPFRQIQQIIAAGIETGELRRGDFFVSAVSFTGVIIRATELRLQGVLQTSLFEIKDELIDNGWAAIKA